VAESEAKCNVLRLIERCRLIRVRTNYDEHEQQLSWNPRLNVYSQIIIVQIVMQMSYRRLNAAVY